MGPITADLSQSETYPLTDVQCSKTDTPPPATSERVVTMMEVWQEMDWVGLRILKCQALAKAT